MSDVGGERSYYDNAELWQRERFVGNAVQARRYAATMALIPSSVQSLLDVGAGNGAFLAFLETERNSSMRLLGLERSAVAIEMAVCEAPVTLGSIDDLPFANGAFDCVSALEVLEHLPFSVFENALREVSRVAREYILVSVPYREKRRAVTCLYCGCAFNPYYHMRSFDEESLRNVFPSHVLKSSTIVPVLEPVLLPTLRRLRTWGRPRRPKPTALCPQCGYSLSASGASVPEADPAPGRARRLWRRFAEQIPQRERPNWIVALYERADMATATDSGAR